MKNKIKIVLVLCLVVVLAFPCIANASEVNRLPEPPQDEVSPNVFIYKSTSGSYYCVLHNNEERVEFVPYDSDYDGIVDSGAFVFTGYKCYKLVDGKWDFVNSSDIGVTTTLYWGFSDVGVSSIDNMYKSMVQFLVYSDLSVYDTDSGIYFFYETSRNMSLSSGLSTQTITNLILTQVLSLIPLLISLLVSVVAFFKGYRLLRQALVGV